MWHKFFVVMVVVTWTMEWNSKRNFHVLVWTLRLFTAVDQYFWARCHIYIMEMVNLYLTALMQNGELV
jgi:hypothetical protein